MDGQGVEEYYRKYIALQERLRQSEEERLQLEMKFNNMIQVTQEEEQLYFKRLKSQYKGFMEEHQRRQERNAQILHLLERVESRAAALEAKSKRFKLLRHQYHSFLNRVEQGRKLPSAEIVNDFSPNRNMPLNPDIDPPVFRPVRSELTARRIRDLHDANQLSRQDKVKTLIKESPATVVIEDDTDDSTTSVIPTQNGFKHSDLEEDEKLQQTDLVTEESKQEVVEKQNGGPANVDINQNSLETVEIPKIETIVENNHVKEVSGKMQIIESISNGNKEENEENDNVMTPIIETGTEGDVNNITNDETKESVTEDIQEENKVIAEQIDNGSKEEVQEGLAQNGEIELTTEGIKETGENNDNDADYQHNIDGTIEELIENQQNIEAQENINYDQVDGIDQVYQNQVEEPQEHYDSNAQNEYDDQTSAHQFNQPNDPNNPEIYYDENGQPIQYDINNQQEEYKYDQQYDENGQPINYDPNYQNYQYDENGQIVDYSQGEGQGAGQVYDEHGQVVNYDQTSYEQPATEAENPNVYYDENGQMITYDYQGPESQEMENAPGQEVDAQLQQESEGAGLEVQSEAPNVLDLLDTESASSHNPPANENKEGNESDFDFSASSDAQVAQHEAK